MLYPGNAATAIHIMLIRYYVMFNVYVYLYIINGITSTFNLSSYNNQDLA